MIRTYSLILSSLLFIIVIGGAVYEHVAVIPVWSAAAPASLGMFHGEHAIAAHKFWIPIHPFVVALLVASLMFNWRSESRNYILATLAGYIVILGITAVYFVPELLDITQTAVSPIVDVELTRRAKTWEALSAARLVFLLALAVALLLGLSRSHGERSVIRSI